MNTGKSLPDRTWSFLYPLLFAGVVLLAAAPLPSCSVGVPRGDSDRAGTTYRQTPKPRIDVSRLERRIHDLVNAERRRHGLSSLSWDGRLGAIAREHSKDMHRRNFFSHDSPEGHDFSVRYNRSGYQCAVRQQGAIHLGAENILLNHLYDKVTTVNGVPYYDWNSEEKIAETTVKGWLGSAGHRKNILTPYWKNEGIGIFISPDDKVYITQNFC